MRTVPNRERGFDLAVLSLRAARLSRKIVLKRAEPGADELLADTAESTPKAISRGGKRASPANSLWR
jgi:hypothetical protein